MLNNIVAIYGRTQSKLPTAAPQQSNNTITLQRAIADGVSPAALRAVATWNERESHNQRRRKARARHKAQCVALCEVATQMEESYVESYREAA